MKIDLDKITIGHSPLSGKVYAGQTNKAQTEWLKKVDITNAFVHAVIQKYEGIQEEVESYDGKWIISVQKIK